MGSKYCHSSTKPDNLAKIGPVDFEIIGETGIVKNKYYKWETEAEHRARRPDFSSRAGEIKFTRTITVEGCRSPIIYVDMAIVKSRLFGKDQWGHQDQSIGAWGSGKEEVNNPLTNTTTQIHVSWHASIYNHFYCPCHERVNYDRSVWSLTAHVNCSAAEQSVNRIAKKTIGVSHKIEQWQREADLVRLRSEWLTGDGSIQKLDDPDRKSTVREIALRPCWNGQSVGSPRVNLFRRSHDAGSDFTGPPCRWTWVNDHENTANVLHFKQLVFTSVNNRSFCNYANWTAVNSDERRRTAVTWKMDVCGLLHLSFPIFSEN